MVNDHGSNKQRFNFRVLKCHRTAMNRQISEWLLIVKGNKAGPTLNSKNEWNCERLLRVVIPTDNPENPKTRKKGGSNLERPNKRVK